MSSNNPYQTIASFGRSNPPPVPSKNNRGQSSGNSQGSFQSSDELAERLRQIKLGKERVSEQPSGTGSSSGTMSLEQKMKQMSMSMPVVSSGEGNRQRFMRFTVNKNKDLDAQRQDFRAYQYLVRCSEVLEWLKELFFIQGKVIDIEMNTDRSVIEMLRDGEWLVSLTNQFAKEKVHVHTNIDMNGRLAFMKSTDNIQNFMKQAVSDLKLPEVYMFSFSALWERKNITAVIHCLHALAHHLEKNGYLEGLPKIKNLSSANLHFDKNLLLSIEEQFKFMEENSIQLHLDFGFGEDLDNIDPFGVNLSVHDEACPETSFIIGKTRVPVDHRNDQDQFLVQLCDKNRHNLKKGGDKVECWLERGQKKVYVTVQDNQDGTYTLDIPFDKLTVGQYDVVALVNGKELPRKKLIIVAGDAYALQTKVIDSSGLTIQHYEGLSYHFSIQVCDRNGNHKLTPQGVNVDVRLNYQLGNKLLRSKYSEYIEFQPDTKLWSIYFRPPLPGNYSLDLEVNGGMVLQFPVQFTVFKIPDPGMRLNFLPHNPSVIQFNVEVEPLNMGSSQPRFISCVLQNRLPLELPNEDKKHVFDLFSKTFLMWLKEARQQAFQYYMNPNAPIEEFSADELAEPNLAEGEILWRLIERHVNKEFTMMEYWKQFFRLKSSPHNGLQHVAFSDVITDWTEFDRQQKLRQDQENLQKQLQDHPLYDPLRPRLSALNFWTMISRMINETKQNGTMSFLDKEQQIAQFEHDKMVLLEYGLPNYFNVPRMADLHYFAHQHLLVGQRFVFEIIREVKESFPQEIVQLIEGDLMNLGRQCFADFKAVHEMYRCISARTDFIMKHPLPEEEIDEEGKQLSKKLIGTIRREFLKNLLKVTNGLRKLMLQYGASKSEVNKLFFQSTFIKGNLNALFKSWRIAIALTLSERIRNIMVQHIVLPLPHNTMGKQKTTQSYAVQVPINSLFDSTINRRTCVSTKDRQRAGLCNPYKVAYIKNDAVVFEALRCGALPPYEIKDASVRMSIAGDNACELLQTFAMNHAKRFTRKELMTIVNQNQALDIPFTTISLMTPFCIPDREDRIAVEHQTALLNALADKRVTSVEVDLCDGQQPLTLAVNFPSPCLLNFGTNMMLKTLQQGIYTQRMMNARIFGMRRFEEKVNSYLGLIEERKRELREMMMDYLNKHYFSNTRADQMMRQAIEDRTRKIKGIFLVRMETKKTNMEKIHILDFEMLQKQQKLEKMIAKRVIPSLDNVTKLEMIQRLSVRGLVNDINSLHKKIYHLEQEYQSLDEQLEWEDQYVKELIVMFNNKPNKKIPPFWTEYNELTQKEKDIDLLFGELRALYHNLKHENFSQGLYESESVKTVDPYSVPVRLSLLSFAIGEQLMVCCKSAKDRTGQWNDQVMEYAEWRYQFGEYPSAKKAREKFNEHRKIIHTTIALNSSTGLICKENTGVPGSKTDKSTSGRYLKGMHAKYTGLSSLDSMSFSNGLLAENQTKRFLKLYKKVKKTMDC